MSQNKTRENKTKENKERKRRITFGRPAVNKYDHLYTDRNGYIHAVLESDTHGWRDLYLHEIVASTFVSNPNNYNKVKHKDGNKENNRADNLEWVEFADYY